MSMITKTETERKTMTTKKNCYRCGKETTRTFCRSCAHMTAVKGRMTEIKRETR